jgi:hypothetical protein
MVFEQIENANAYNCFIASVATLAKYYGRDYHMISGSDWKLRYNSGVGSERIGERIDVVSQVDAACRVKQFHGFIWEMELFEECHIDADAGGFKEFTFPFLVSVDLYFSRWSKFYQKYHFLHYLIISDYNSKNKTYTCIDPYFQYAQYNVSKEDLYPSMDKCGKLIFFEITEKSSVEDYIKAIREDIMMVDKDNENCTNIIQLANDICTKIDIHYEFDEFKNELHAVPIMDRIRKVAMYREAYSCMLDYVYKLSDLKYLKDASGVIKQSVDLWKAIQGKLLKTYLTNSINSERETISQMIKQIADVEKQAVKIILFNK